MIRHREPRDRVLVACIGNIFQGDDAVGCEVARRLFELPRLPGARVVDFGIRAYDLAYAMLDDWDLVILVDATQRGGSPGTLYVIEPDLTALDDEHQAARIEAHTMQPVQVLRMAKALGGVLPPLLLVACEVANLGDLDEGSMGLSEPVAAAVNRVPPLLDSIIRSRVGEGQTRRESLAECALPNEPGVDS